MRHAAHPRSASIRTACLAALLITPRAAIAALDLTGSWQVGVSFGGPPVATVQFSFVQNGSQLALTRDAPNGSGSGTIDPETGELSIDFGPFIDSAGAPGPEHVLSGSAAPDGQSFTAMENVCIFEVSLGWACVTATLTGIPGEGPPPVCGNSRVERGEDCDEGARSGTSACCTSSCTFVDADDDGLCNLIDNCPQEPNPTQSDLDEDFIGDACDTSTLGTSIGQLVPGTGSLRVTTSRSGTRLVLRATYVGEVDLPTTIQLRDVGGVNLDLASLTAWAAKQCSTSTGGIFCVAPDGSLKLVVQRSRRDPGSAEFRLALRNAPIAAPLAAPFIVSLHVPAGGHRGILYACKRRGDLSLRCGG